MSDIKYWLNFIIESLPESQYKQSFIDSQDNGHNLEECLDEECLDYDKLVTDKYTLSIVDYHGGEGQGDDYYIVYKLDITETGEEVYIKFEGCYSSWNGVDWYHGPRLVTPRQVTITVYD